MFTLHRRNVLTVGGMGALGCLSRSWIRALAEQSAADPNRRRQCIVLWMSGGPTQTDTFDMKPGHANGGEFKEIETSAPGLKISEHLPKLAKYGHRIAPIRSLSTKEGDHSRGTYLMKTGHVPGGPIHYPTVGSSLSKALGTDSADLPNYVSIAPYTFLSPEAFSPGFLGPRYAALTVGATNNFNLNQGGDGQQPDYAQLGVDDLSNSAGITSEQAKQRLEIWNKLQARFLDSHKSASPNSHQVVYQRALRMMHSDAAKAFDLTQESSEVRDAYGRSRFGQGCLMARRLIEAGVPCVEVSLGDLNGNALGWDTHADNFNLVKGLSGVLDAGWGTLMRELDERGLLDSTTILWMGEFGRTPKINEGAGRDHFPDAWTCVLAGGGIKGGQAYGKSSDGGEEVVENKVGVGDVLATMASALGVDPGTSSISEVGRPIKIAEGQPIKDLIA